MVVNANPKSGTTKMCSSTTSTAPYNLRKHTTSTTTSIATSTSTSTSTTRRTTQTKVATVRTQAATPSAANTVKPASSTKSVPKSTNRPTPSTGSVDESNPPYRLRTNTVIKSNSLAASAIKKLCFERQSTIMTSLDNDTTVTNDITVIEKKIDAKNKKRTNIPPPTLTQVRSKPSKAINYDEDGDDSEEDRPKPSVPVSSQKAPPNKRFRKLRLCDTPHTPKTLMKKASLLVPTPEPASSPVSDSAETTTLPVPVNVSSDTSPLPFRNPRLRDELMKTIGKSPKSLSRRKHFPVSQTIFGQDVEMCDHESAKINIEITATKTPSRFQSFPRFCQPANKALTFEDSDSDENTNSSTEITMKTTTTLSSSRPLAASTGGVNELVRPGHHRKSSLHTMSSPNTPHPVQQPLHASINPFTPPANSSTTITREFSLARVAAANYTAIKQKASSMAMLSTEKSRPVTDTPPVENARLPIRKCSVSRYHQEFHEVCKLGAGEFGDVFKCINRLDGCTYAIKRSKQAIAGSAMEVLAWKEVCAHAALVKHNHIVQYYSAWAEQDRMLIQNEYCNGGSLAEFLDSLKLGNIQSASPSSSNSSITIMNEADLKTLLLHVAKGLSYMHSLHLAHLDIKPGNIFICRVPRRHHHHHIGSSSSAGSAASSDCGSSVVLNEESGIESDDSEAESTTSSVATTSIFSELVTYKIGDLGHVTSTVHENPHVEEGDCRYLPNEILHENYSWLVKADIFALALTVYVAGSLDDLPKNGDEWHWIRRGNLKDLAQCSSEFKKLLTQMIDEDPSRRPSASTLVHHPCICPDSTKSKAQLRRELNQEKFKNEILQRKVKKYEEQIHKLDSPINTDFNVFGSNRRLQPFVECDLGSKSNTRLPRSLSSTLV